MRTVAPVQSPIAQIGLPRESPTGDQLHTDPDHAIGLTIKSPRRDTGKSYSFKFGEIGDLRGHPLDHYAPAGSPVRLITIHFECDNRL